jgi:hypothetical protein
MADPALDVAVEVVRNRASLGRIVSQWQDLARHALEPNPLYEPDTLLPELHAAGDGDLHCYVAWARDPERSDLPAHLGGLFPFRRERSLWGLSSWTLCKPLVRAKGAQRHLAALLHALERNGVGVVEFRHLPRGGGLSDLLADVLRDHKSTLFAYDVPAPQSVAQCGGLRNLVIGLGAMGEMWVSMLPLLNWTRQRIAAASRSDSSAVTM